MKYLSLSIPGPGGSIKLEAPPGVPTGGLFDIKGNPDTGIRTIDAILGVIIIIAFSFAVYNLGQATISMITSGGEKEKFKSGRERIRYSIIGLILIFLSFFFIQILGHLFGINLLSFYK